MFLVVRKSCGSLNRFPQRETHAARMALHLVTDQNTLDICLWLFGRRRG